MLQIRLSKGPSIESSGGAAAGTPAKSSSVAAVVAAASLLPPEPVTVACPDHLVLADLPVAKCLGVITSAASTGRSLGRRSRRGLGERVHICVRCDFPISIYGRLIPCEHAFCLACARSDASCYLCEERIQKIQTLKMMEGIFICAAPHCLKSFLKKSDFESHINEVHADLLHPQTEKEGRNEPDGANVARPFLTEPQRQSSLPESSTARAPQRPVFSPTSSSQVQDHDDISRWHPPKDQPPPKPPLQPRPPLQSQNPNQPPGDQQPETNAPQGFDRSYMFSPHQTVNQNSIDRSSVPPESPLPAFPAFPAVPFQPPSHPAPVNVNPTMLQVPFTYPAFPPDGSQPYFHAPQGTPQREKQPESGPEQGAVVGFPPSQAGVPGFPDNMPPSWAMGFMAVPVEHMQVAQGFSEGYPNSKDSQGRAQLYQSKYSQLQQGIHLNPTLEMKPGSLDQNEGKTMTGALPSLQVPQRLQLPPPPPVPPLQMPLHFNSTPALSGSDDIPPGYGWPADNRRFGTAPN